MRKILFVLLAAALLLSSCSAPVEEQNAPEPENTAAQAPDIKPSPTARPMATHEPEPKLYSPADILGSAELNPFYDLDLPDSFYLESVMIHTPGWEDIIGDMVQYHMYYVVPKEDESVRALALIMGVESEDKIAGYIGTFWQEGWLMFDGYNSAGMCDCVAEIYITNKPDGWQVHLVSEIPEKNGGRYQKFIEDNFNMTLLAGICEEMDLTPIPREYKIDTVYIDRDDMKKASFSVVYRSEDIAGVVENVLSAGRYSHYYENSGVFSYSYGILFASAVFDIDNGTMHIYQTCKGIPDTAISEYENRSLWKTTVYGFPPTAV